METDRRTHVMKRLLSILTLCAALGISAGHGQQAPPTQVGYAFPPGARQGSAVEILVGGQRLASAKGVTVSGDGVTAKLLKYYKPVQNLQKEQREEIRERFEARRFALTGKSQQVRGGKATGSQDGEKAEPVELPPHPLLDKIPTMSLRELENAQTVVFDTKRMQPNRQLAELVMVRLEVAADAQPGLRELRLYGRDGMTNPILIEIGLQPEFTELEPNGGDVHDPAFTPPFVINGQLLPGDIDRFRFSARKGRTYEVRVEGRSLTPFVADAVPGWIQLTLQVRDSGGREVAYADDTRFEPDPRLRFAAGEDGEYELVVHDAIYRGREDFVYRVLVEEAVGGGTSAQGPPIRLPDLPKVAEVEPNNELGSANAVTLPCLVQGRVDQPGEEDWYRFEGRAGQIVVLDVVARRAGSPLDSVVRLWDGAGNLIAWNDDYSEKEGHLFLTGGVQTHAADSRVRQVLQADGAYAVSIVDAQRGAGPAYFYNLRVSQPLHDFALSFVPSSMVVPSGGRVMLTVHAFRQDRFDGEIELEMLEPSGFRLESAVIPAGASHADVTLVAPLETSTEPRELRLVGRARIAGKEVERQAGPADDCMQAFLYRHLVAARQGLVVLQPRRQAATELSVTHEVPIRVPKSGTVVVPLHTASQKLPENATVELKRGPSGVKIVSVEARGKELLVTLTAEGDEATPGEAGNLIFELYGTRAPPKAAPVAQPKRRVSAGLFPATSAVVVKTDDQPQI